MPEINLDDTIAAIATAAGVGAIGIVRLSGKDAVIIASKFFRPAKANQTLEKAKSHTIHFGIFFDEKGNTVDEVLVSVFRAPHSYTADDVVEINAHGGPKILEKILDLVCSAGARQAEPGEFTRRAFLNGRMDLTQAEAVLDLIAAKTERSVKIALRQLEGKLSDEIKRIKEELMLLYAHLEACLDFPDEHLEIVSDQEVKRQFGQIMGRIQSLISTFSKTAVLREGVLTVIVGRPNVGKSSLLNALLERDRAIVSDIPGTTRDSLEESIVLNGLWIRLVDTAGLAPGGDALDQAARNRTKKYLDQGDLFLWVLDGSQEFSAADEVIIRELEGKRVIAVVNKSDLSQKIQTSVLESKISLEHTLRLSAKTGNQIDALEEKISSMVLREDFNSEFAVITRARHKNALESALEYLNKSEETFLSRQPLELVTLDLRAALDRLRELIGELYSEDLLDLIFREFCIGK